MPHCFFRVRLHPLIFKKKLFIYLFLTDLGLHCCSCTFPSCGEWSLLLFVGLRLPTAVASLVELGLKQLWPVGFRVWAQ